MYNSLPCAELVDQTAQRPNVAFDVVRLTINELRRHVVRRLREPRWRLGREGARLIRGTHSDVGLCHGRLRHRLAEPEVAKLEVVIPIEEDWVLRISTRRRRGFRNRQRRTVLGLDVAVEDDGFRPPLVVDFRMAVVQRKRNLG